MAHLALCVEGAEEVGELIDVLSEAIGSQICEHVLQSL